MDNTRTQLLRSGDLPAVSDFAFGTFVYEDVKTWEPFLAQLYSGNTAVAPLFQMLVLATQTTPIYRFYESAQGDGPWTNMTIAVEGEIGAGKRFFMKALETHLATGYEWKDRRKFVVVERSLWGNSLFAHEQAESGHFGPLDKIAYDAIMQCWTYKFPDHGRPRLILRVRPSLEVCMQRIADRNRASERNGGVSLAYQEALRVRHDSAFGTTDGFARIIDNDHAVRVDHPMSRHPEDWADDQGALADKHKDRPENFVPVVVLETNENAYTDSVGFQKHVRRAGALIYKLTKI